MGQIRPTQDERLLATLAHASILLGYFTSGIGGIIAALVIWLTQREKSKYIAFQALQAMAYQVAGLLLFFIVSVCYICSVFGSLFPAFINPEAYREAPPPTFFFAMCLIFPFFLVILAFVLYALWGAWCTWRGRNFRYILIGNLVERFAK